MIDAVGKEESDGEVGGEVEVSRSGRKDCGLGDKEVVKYIFPSGKCVNNTTSLRFTVEFSELCLLYTRQKLHKLDKNKNKKLSPTCLFFHR